MKLTYWQDYEIYYLSLVKFDIIKDKAQSIYYIINKTLIRMNFFTLSDDDIQKQKMTESYKKYITSSVKAGQLNLLEYSYMLDYENIGGTLVNASWFLDLTKKINNDELNLIITKQMSKLFCIKEGALMLNSHDLPDKLILEKKNIIDFTKDQQDSIKKICNFIPDFNTKMFGLYGYAGTGKTTTIVEIVTYLLKHKIIKSVVFAAPTHKALNVVKSTFRKYLKELYTTHCGGELEKHFSFEDVVDRLYEKNIKIEFITIHGLLKFETDYNSKGEKIFIRGNGESLISQYEIILIDECSMIQLKMIDQILNEIRLGLKSSDNYKKVPKVIFTGDPAQLPPVFEKNSVIFIKNKEELKIARYVKTIQGDESVRPVHGVKFDTDLSSYDEYKNKYEMFVGDIINMPTITLKKVMRSKLDAVTKVCYQLRRWTMGEIEVPDLNRYWGKEGVFYYKYKIREKKIETEWFNKCLEYYKNGRECNIIITWTNEQANEYNQVIRSTIFKSKTLDRFMVGDILVINNFYNIDGEQVDGRFDTSEQIKVVKIEKINKNVNGFTAHLTKTALKLQNSKYYETKLKDTVSKINDNTKRSYECWKLHVKRISEIPDAKNDDIYAIYVVDKESEKLLSAETDFSLHCIKKLRSLLLNKFRDKGKQIDTHIIKPLWKERYGNFIEPFADINYGYAITCHKGQGSNFYNVFVDVDDICKNNDEDETKKCIYTAATRASYELHMLLS